MKTLNYKLFISLTLAAALGASLTGCGDETDSRVSDDDVVCLKIIRNGGTCGSGTATSTTTITATATTTQSETSTVTVTNTSTN